MSHVCTWCARSGDEFSLCCDCLWRRLPLIKLMRFLYGKDAFISILKGSNRIGKYILSCDRHKWRTINAKENAEGFKMADGSGLRTRLTITDS